MYVDASAECFRTRVQLPPPPPAFAFRCAQSFGLARQIIGTPKPAQTPLILFSETCEGCHAVARRAQAGRFSVSKIIRYSKALHALPIGAKLQLTLSTLLSAISLRMVFYYVYILQSEKEPHRHYTGFTKNLSLRLKSHNSGLCRHTSKFRPWRIKTAIAFSDRRKALEFEKYLKSGSGRAFASKRF
jgi:putative endonuclease